MIKLNFIFILCFISISLFFIFLIINVGTQIPVQHAKDDKRKKTAQGNNNTFLLLEKLIPKRYKNFLEKLILKACLENINVNKLMLIQVSLSTLILFILLISGSFFLSKIASALLLAIFSGGGIPLFLIYQRSKTMEQKTGEVIPFFADILTLSCEAGLDIFASLHDILTILEANPLKDKIESLLKDIKMGQSRQKALRQAYSKTESWDLKTIFLTISQAENLGTPIGKSLRNQVEIMRSDRLNRAEKHAQEAPLKLMIPLLLCIFPVTLATLISPIILRFINGEIF